MNLERFKLSDPEINNVVEEAFKADYLLEHRVGNRGHWEQIAPAIAKAQLEAIEKGLAEERKASPDREYTSDSILAIISYATYAGLGMGDLYATPAEAYDAEGLGAALDVVSQIIALRGSNQGEDNTRDTDSNIAQVTNL